MENQITEVWVLTIYRPVIGKNAAGWYDVGAFTTPQKVEGAIAKLAANGRMTTDPESVTEENPAGSSWKMKRLDVR